MTELERLQESQSGVVTRRQLLDRGATRTSVARSLRRGEVIPVHPGVYIAHNGPLSWLERAWAAVLWAAPAALCLESAQRLFEGRGLDQRDKEVIHLAVPRDRHLQQPPGIRIHRTAHFGVRVQDHLSPPRVRYDDTVLDLAERARDDLAAISVLAAACGSRRTTASRLLESLERRPRIHRRHWLEAILRDVMTGTCSVLEHGYLDRVERPHGLPAGRRQAPGIQDGRRMWQDVRYEEWGLRVELDGTLGHAATEDRDRDLERDLDAAVGHDETTLRLGYGQVFARGCRTATKVGLVLNRLGWPGEVHPCPKCGG